MSLDSCTADLMRRSKQLESMPIETADGASIALRERLESSEERHATIAAEVSLLRRDFDLLQTEKRALVDRLEVLRIDLDRNNDAKKLQALGSVLGSAASTHTCPTCHQDTTRELLPEATARSMGIDENIAFIRSQLDLYEAMQRSTDAELDAVRIRYRSLEDEASNLRGEIRAIKDDLVRPGAAPTHSAVQELVRLESRLLSWRGIRANIDGAVDELKQLASDWSEFNGKLKALGTGNLSSADKDKLADMQRIMQQLLRDFGFSSFKPEEITLSEDVFRPQVLTRDDEGEIVEKDIGFEVSASDGIRLKWAYYLSMLALSQIKVINHVGLLAFDEPGQQQMKNVDLSTLLKWASINVAQDRQMIISTSEDLSRVHESVATDSSRVHSFSGYILKPIEELPT